MDSDVCAALRLTVDAFFSFRTEFGVELSLSNLCEIYVALQLGLPMPRMNVAIAHAPPYSASLRTNPT
jgi:hypothetical protein